MHPESTGRVTPAPNVTPMIDVMLVLLCIFMVVTPALANGMVAEPPRAEHLAPRPEEPTDHTLAIDIHGAFYLDRRPIAAAALAPALAALYPAGTADRVLFVRAHRELAFGAVDAALEVARANGVSVVGLVSQDKEP